MSGNKRYFVYILSSDYGVLYTGVTNDLSRRLEEHRTGSTGFPARYRVKRLVYWEETEDIRSAIAREICRPVFHVQPRLPASSMIGLIALPTRHVTWAELASQLHVVVSQNVS